MTLDEAINHWEEKAKELKRELEIAEAYNLESEGCYNRFKEHEQLAEWLKELKEIREAYESDYQIQDVIEVCVKLWG